MRWHTCGLCEQQYHGVVEHALGWACWKTYLGRPEADQPRFLAMTLLGNGLLEVDHYAEALTVQEAELSVKRRIGLPEANILATQSNIARTYGSLGRVDQALNTYREVYSRSLKLHGAEHEETLSAANNYATTLGRVQRFEEAKSLLRKTIPATRRVFGESDRLTLMMRKSYAKALYHDTSATLDDLREAVETLEETAPTARRVFGGAHPTAAEMDRSLQNARQLLILRSMAAMSPPSGSA